MGSRATVPLIIAHRGGAPNHPDNSWSAFQQALSAGIRILECDIQPSRDGQLVVIHDDTIFGVPVQHLSMDQLRALVPDILTFGEFIKRLDAIDPSVRLVIDLKGASTDRWLIPYLTDPKLRAHALITSKHSASLRRISRQFEDARLGLSRGATLTVSMPAVLRPRWTSLMRATVATIGLLQARWAGCRYLALQYHLLDERLVNWIHRFGMRIDAWTVDDPATARDIAARGVDLITSNEPVALHQDREDDLI